MRFLALLATAFVGCGSPPDLPLATDASARRGAVKSVERVGGQPGWLAKTLVWWAGMSERLPVEHGTTLYRVEYWTVDPTGDFIPASGLVALPRASVLRGVVSWQHGTTVERTEVPSKPTPDEGVVVALAFAGHGYLLAAPDYLGLGSSPARPTWLGERLRENDLGAFMPRAPVCAYYGSLDVDVSPEEARAQARCWAAHGVDARAIDVGAFDHEASVLEAAPLVRAWFDELAGADPSRRP
jgi:hypothetical protein